MKSSEDVQILPFAWRANRARCVLSIRLKPSKVDTKPGLRSPGFLTTAGVNLIHERERPGESMGAVFGFLNNKQTK
jgi:hypothetical protein